MRSPIFAVLAAALATLAGCAGLSTAAPVSTDSIGSPEQMPQSANSLPLGAAVDTPIVSPGDAVSTARIGPSAAMPKTAAPGSSPLSYPPRRIQ